MGKNKANWLPHLPYEVVEDARGWNLDAYVVALEGWRRGLTLKWHTKNYGKFKEMRTWFVDSPGRLFSLSSQDKTHYFFRTRGDLVTNEAVDIGGDKFKTKEILQSKNIPIPRGKQFDKYATKSSIVDYAKIIGFPVVLKPVDGSFGRGVFTELLNEDELIDSFNSIRSTSQEDNLIIEKHIYGKEYRLYVVDGEVVGAIHRIPANVIGDGISTIKALIIAKNKIRSTNPRLYSCPIIINDELVNFLQKENYSLNDIPQKNEQVFLNDKSNISQGGDSVDVLDELPHEVKQTAIRGLHAIRGLGHGAVDLIIDKNEKDPNKVGKILELNPTSQIGSILFPMVGKARDIPASIVDYYFPETQKDSKFLQNMYFDYKESILPLCKQTAISVQVQKVNSEKAVSLVYTFKTSSENQSDNIGKIIRKLAMRNNLSGSASVKKNQEVKVIVAGDEKSQHLFTEELETENFHLITTEKYSHPVKLGFELKAAKKQYIDTIISNDEKYNQLKNEQIKLEKRYSQMLNSNSWKISAPLRLITGLLKR